MGDNQHPLLSHAAEDDLWDEVEEGSPLSERPITVKELVSSRPSEVIRTIQRNTVRKVAEFLVEDHLVLGRLGDDSILTMGSDRARLPDPEHAWLDFLGAHAHRYKAAAQRRGGRRTNDGSGWDAKIPVLAYTLSVENVAAPDKDGILQPLLRRWQANGCGMDVFALPAVQAVIDWKWETYCQTILLGEWLLFMLWLVFFAAFTILFQDEDTSHSLAELVKTGRGRATVATNILSLVAMTPFLGIEAATLTSYGFWGWLNAWNILDVATYAIQVYIGVVHLGRLELKAGWLSIAAAVQCILLLFRLQYFSRVFKSTRFSFVDDIKEVLHDVKFYLIFILLVCCGWGLALHILFREEQKAHKEFSTYPRTLLTMVSWLDGDVDLDKLSESMNPVAASLLGVGFIFVMGVILMNMLIGILTASLEKVTSNEGLRMLCSKAEIIDEIDTMLPRFVEKQFPQFYPKYLHILRVDPDKIDKVEKATVWGARQDDVEESDEENSGDKGSDNVGKQVAALQKEVAELKDLIKSLKTDLQSGGKLASS